jgi:hypothetical protein
LSQAIENGVADPDDPTLKDRVAAVKAERGAEPAGYPGARRGAGTEGKRVRTDRKTRIRNAFGTE